MAKKPSLGRQKIKIAKIENYNHLQVTFSKRRVGLFKKASELVTLCGVEICIMVSSPGGKIFSFGHPNIEFIINRFINHQSTLLPIFSQHTLVEARSMDNLKILGLELENILDALEAEKKRGEFLDNMKKDSAKSCWWRAPIASLDLSELGQIRVSMEELKKIVTNKANKHLADQAYFNPSFNSINEIKLPGLSFDFSANSNVDYLGFGLGF